MKESHSLEAYALDEPKVLEQAIHLAPELFAALAIAKKLDSSVFPIEDDKAIERALAAVANAGDHFAAPGVTITAKSARDHFPNEFLPIVDRADLVRKVYMAIVISHKAAAERELKRLDKTHLKGRISHPLPKELE